MKNTTKYNSGFYYIEYQPVDKRQIYAIDDIQLLANIKYHEENETDNNNNNNNSINTC